MRGQTLNKFLIAVGTVIVLILISRANTSKSTAYTKSGNCGGASESTLRFAPEPTAAMFPEAIWFERCPNGKYYMKIGDGDWKEITKENADSGTSTLKMAGRSLVRVVD